jgi:hypothetical protein
MLQTDLLGFWNFAIVLYFKIYFSKNKCFYLQVEVSGGTNSIGPVRESAIFHPEVES